MLEEGLWSLPLLSETVLMESLKGNIVHIVSLIASFMYGYEQQFYP